MAFEQPSFAFEEPVKDEPAVQQEPAVSEQQVETPASQDEPPPVSSFIEETAPPDVPLPPVETPQQEMQPTALVFLSDPIARRLAVAWQTCKGDEKHWLAAAGLESSLFAEANRLCHTLRINNICRDGGVTDKLALQYITTLITNTFTKRGKQK